jgi:hypothetical protein
MGIAMTFPSNAGARNGYSLALLRIGVGILFLIFGQYKVFGTAFTLHGGFQFWISSVRLKLKQIQLFTDVEVVGFIGIVGKTL